MDGSLCGHSWQNWSGDKYRVCLWCRQLQELIDGVWKDAPSVRQGEGWKGGQTGRKRKPYYGDESKALRDLRNYWK
jgi:hypothetical protein